MKSYYSKHIRTQMNNDINSLSHNHTNDDVHLSDYVVQKVPSSNVTKLMISDDDILFRSLSD